MHWTLLLLFQLVATSACCILGMVGGMVYVLGAPSASKAKARHSIPSATSPRRQSGAPTLADEPQKPPLRPLGILLLGAALPFVGIFAAVVLNIVIPIIYDKRTTLYPTLLQILTVGTLLLCLVELFSEGEKEKDKVELRLSPAHRTAAGAQDEAFPSHSPRGPAGGAHPLLSGSRGFDAADAVDRGRAVPAAPLSLSTARLGASAASS